MKNPGAEPKPVRWVGTSKADLSAFPDEVKRLQPTSQLTSERSRM
jgi:hypothetical protein